MKRNSLDIIMTDLRPVELPKIFTLKYFYRYLSRNSKATRDVLAGLDVKKILSVKNGMQHLLSIT